MKTAAQILTLILAIAFILLGFLAASAKLQILNANFWERTYEKYNVYSDLTMSLKQSIVQETISGGGKASEVESITSLFTESNVKDFFNKNLENILNYANDKSTELMVYIPVGIAPKGFLPARFANLPETMTVSALMEKFNAAGVPADRIQYISLVGRGVDYLLIIDLAVLAVLLGVFYILTQSGKRFVAAGAAFFVSGIIVLAFYFLGNLFVTQTAPVLLQGHTAAEVMLGTLAPPLISEILKTWAVAGAAICIFGVVLLFVKKPSVKK